MVLEPGWEVALDRRVADGERLDVHPHPGPRPRPPGPPRFVVDDHLQALARRLRVLGLDATAAGDGIVVTRDRSRLKRADVEHGLLIRSQDPDEQAVEATSTGRAPTTPGRSGSSTTSAGGPVALPAVSRRRAG